MPNNRLSKPEAQQRYNDDKVFRAHVHAIEYMRSVHSYSEIVAIVALAEERVQEQLCAAQENAEKGKVLLVDGRGEKIN